jgi:hypothetical protein
MADPPSDDENLPDSLPPLDGDPDEADGPDDDAQLDDLVPMAGRQETLELDGDEACDLDLGTVLHQSIGEQDEDSEEFVFDIKELLNPSGSDEETACEDDQLGPSHFDTSVGIDALAELGTDDDTEGTDEDIDYLVSSELPGLDADDPGDFQQECWELAAMMPDEEPPPWAVPAWRQQQPPGGSAVSPCGALAVQAGTVVAAGTDLWWLPNGVDSPTRVATHSARVHSVVFASEGADTVLYSTVAGQLLRRRRTDSGPVHLRGWRDACGLRESDPATLQLYRTADASGSVLALVSSGVVLQSSDAGSSWRRLRALDGAVVLSQSGGPVLALARSRGRLTLLRCPDAGLTWNPVHLDRVARGIAGTTAPLLAGGQSVAALAHPARGLAVSNDGGISFARVAGWGSVTALAAGRVGERGTVLAALYRETDELTELCVVDVATRAAQRVATLRIRSETTDTAEETAERSRVLAMQWDSVTERVWAAGHFGVRSFAPGSA